MSEFIHDGFIGFDGQNGPQHNDASMDYANPYSPNYDAKRDPYINSQNVPPVYSYSFDPSEYIYRPYEKLANAAFIISLLSFAFPFMSILSLVFGIITYNKTTMNSEKQLFARAAVGISLGIMIFYFFILLLYIIVALNVPVSQLLRNNIVLY